MVQAVDYDNFVHVYVCNDCGSLAVDVDPDFGRARKRRVMRHCKSPCTLSLRVNPLNLEALLVNLSHAADSVTLGAALVMAVQDQRPPLTIPVTWDGYASVLDALFDPELTRFVQVNGNEALRSGLCSQFLTERINEVSWAESILHKLQREQWRADVLNMSRIAYIHSGHENDIALMNQLIMFASMHCHPERCDGSKNQHTGLCTKAVLHPVEYARLGAYGMVLYQEI